MFALLPELPGIGGVRALARRVDAARHHGVPTGCVLELDLRSAPPETAGFDPLAIITGSGRPLVLRDVVAAIHRAADDRRVAGLIARVQLTAEPVGPIQELRDAITAFTAAKPSLAWAETYPGTLSYYLASAFGEIWMQPSGTVGLVGFATHAVFLRHALRKVGIEAQLVMRGEYKSAANRYTQDRYTDAHREADTRLLESLHAQVWQAVSESRKIAPDVIDRLADRAPLLRDEAVASGLVDRIGFRDQAYARIAELVGAEGISPDTGDADTDRNAPPRRYLARYARASGPRSTLPLPPLPRVPGRKPKPKIAVVTVAGLIVNGRGGPTMVPFGPSVAGGDTIAAALRDAAADDSVSAIVLRVDSRGGTLTASETIWRAVAKARERGKPVVASLGAVAASGGYYIAMGANAIVANPGTITGSIGALAGKFVARELKDRLGIGFDGVRTNANADAWSINAPFTPEQQARVEAEIDLCYRDFVQRVAEGRHLSTEAVEAVARGRIWTGVDAFERGLVDELGGLRAAVRRAKILAGLDEDTEVRLVSYPSASLRELIRQRPSSQPGAVSLPGVAGVLGRAVAGIIGQAEQTSTGVSVLWLGESRFR
ncbi:signal peptide peptidase SppA [Mycobacterium sp. SM1]|uniref:signal peptide peptidase SppA n=1 Tax=Mycobacterium sp. SM1 TaxID=2816243 RepID=UPI001BD1525A|nr:signal peptide peptidase SppA [Mycobacterium sp. SM1]MBS4728818.1 signal peptide peptidase SppA [Mycobacterium sp. SM1]